MRKHFRFCSSCIAVAVFAALSCGMAWGATLKGSVTCDGWVWMSLPDQVFVRVSLVEAGANGSVDAPLAECAMNTRTRFPLPFSMQYDSEMLEAGKTYVITATVKTTDGLALLKTEGGFPVLQSAVTTGSDLKLPVDKTHPLPEGSESIPYLLGGIRADVLFVEGWVVLDIKPSKIKLPQAISGSGARYSDDVTTFWIKGDDATLETSGSVIWEE